MRAWLTSRMPNSNASAPGSFGHAAQSPRLYDQAVAAKAMAAARAEAAKEVLKLIEEESRAEHIVFVLPLTNPV